jgi:hypothetical protein
MSICMFLLYCDACLRICVCGSGMLFIRQWLLLGDTHCSPCRGPAVRCRALAFECTKARQDLRYDTLQRRQPVGKVPFAIMRSTLAWSFHRS